MLHHISDFPEFMLEWNWEKNTQLGLNPNVLTKSSRIRVWWKCKCCGCEWSTMLRSRIQKHSGCPECGKKRMVESHYQTTLQKKGGLSNALLLQEWDYEANGHLTPDLVTAGSGKNVGWVCSRCGYKWKAKVLNRALLERGCPCCSNKITVAGTNDLATTHPNLAKEWDYDKNGDLLPSAVTHGSGKKVYWICPKGHSYQATVLHRTSGTNCPICNAGRQTSFAEQAFYFYIKKIHPDAINRYTEIFRNGMEVDIYIPSMKIAVEYDGVYWHKNRSEREKEKYRMCKQNGIRLVRIRESEEINCQGIADQIFHIDKIDKIQNLNNLILFFLQNLEMWSGSYIAYTVDVNVSRDEFEIRKYMTERKNETLEKEHPELVREWCYEKNRELLPSMFTSGSSQVVWWKCSACGHTWRASISHRARGTGCNACYRKKNRGAAHIESKSVFQYSIEGEYLREWRCISDASRELKINSSNISMCAKHHRSNAGGYRWEYFHVDRLDPITKTCKSPRTRKGIAIVQLDERCNVVNEFVSLNEAARSTNIDATSISKVLHGKAQTAGGYFWKQKQQN